MGRVLSRISQNDMHAPTFYYIVQFVIYRMSMVIFLAERLKPIHTRITASVISQHDIVYYG